MPPPVQTPFFAYFSEKKVFCCIKNLFFVLFKNDFLNLLTISFFFRTFAL